MERRQTNKDQYTLMARYYCSDIVPGDVLEVKEMWQEKTGCKVTVNYDPTSLTYNFVIHDNEPIKQEVQVNE